MAFKENKVIETGQTFLFKDNAQEYSANDRYMRFYELSGMSYVAFGDQSRLIITEDYVEGRLKKIGLEKFISRFEGVDRVSLSEYVYSPPSNKIEFNKRNLHLHKTSSFIKLFYYYYFDHAKYEEKLMDMFEIEVNKIT